jgi:T-complex protein 1 subunit delta
MQIVSQYSSILAPIAVDGVKRLASNSSTNVDLRDIRIVKKVGGTIDDTELVDGVALNQNVNTAAGGPTRIEKPKIGLIQFQLSAPKPDVSDQYPRFIELLCTDGVMTTKKVGRG